MFSRTFLVVASVLLLQPITVHAQLLRHRKQKDDKPLVVQVLNTTVQPIVTPVYHVEPEISYAPAVRYYHSSAVPTYRDVEPAIVRERLAPIATVANAIPVRTPSIIAPRDVSAEIYLANPSDTEGPLYFTLNDVVSVLNPGESKSLRNDREWIIKFDNGNSKEVVYRLTEGSYEFSVSHTTGWDLVRRTSDATSTRGASGSVATPANVIPRPTAALSMSDIGSSK